LDLLNAATQTIAWCVIAVFFAIAQCFGAIGPVVYGSLIAGSARPRPY
jgi:hypothetical protein